MGPSESVFQGRALSTQNPRSVATTPSVEEIRALLAKILKSRPFARSQRICRFLQYSVDQALAGSGEEIKEYHIGRDVFDRKADYDPRVDPIVRVEARRLREKLRTYYSTTSGKEDALIIELPKGAYVPQFRPRLAKRPAVKRTTCSAIAVLPFHNLHPEIGDEYFVEGLAEELNLLLTRVEGLRVVAWHSAAQLREDDPKVIGERLKVDFVLTGSVRRTPDRVRITVQLVNTKTGAMLWSDAYSRAMSRLLALEEEVARAIVDALRKPLGLAGPGPAPRSIRNIECYNLCLKGRFHANRRTPAALRESAQCYAKAIELDPECATAHAGLADAHSLFADYGLADPQDVIPIAEAAALRALELDPQLADAMASLAFIRSIYHWRWDEGEELYRRAIELNPSNAKARHWFGTDHLMMRGRFEEALEQVQVARMLDPLSLIIHEGHAYLHVFKRDYATAMATLRQMIEMDPRFAKAHGSLGRALSLTGRYEEALEEFDKAVALSGKSPQLVAAIGHTRALAGDPQAARGALQELDRFAQKAYVPSSTYGLLHIALGDTSKAMDCFEKAAERRGFQVAAFRLHPLYDSVRQHPRFQEIMKRVGV